MTSTFHFSELAAHLGLGDLVSEPLEIKSGIVNNALYKIETSEATYAIKVLIPSGTVDDSYRERFAQSERMASLFSEFGVPALTALTFNSSTVTELNGNFYVVYPWFEGKSLKRWYLDKSESQTLGALHGQIHSINLHKHLDNTSTLKTLSTKKIRVPDFDKLLAQGEEKGMAWTSYLKENQQRLYDLSKQLKKQLQQIDGCKKVISHNDFHAENIMINENHELAIIDWETIGWVDPEFDLLKYICCVTNASHPLEKELVLLENYLQGYRTFRKLPHRNYKALMSAIVLEGLALSERAFKNSLAGKWTEASAIKRLKNVLVWADRIDFYAGYLHAVANDSSSDSLNKTSHTTSLELIVADKPRCVKALAYLLLEPKLLKSKMLNRLAR